MTFTTKYEHLESVAMYLAFFFFLLKNVIKIEDV